MWLLFLLKYIAFPAALILQGLQDFQVILSHKEHFFSLMKRYPNLAIPCFRSKKYQLSSCRKSQYIVKFAPT